MGLAHLAALLGAEVTVTLEIDATLPTRRAGHVWSGERYGLSQSKFAALMGISVGTLRNWEQGRRRPEGSARVLLRVVDRHPGAVLDVQLVRTVTENSRTLGFATFELEKE